VGDAARKPRQAVADAGIVVARDEEPLEAAVLDFDEVAAATEAVQVMAQLARRGDMGGSAESAEVDAGAFPDDGA